MSTALTDAAIKAAAKPGPARTLGDLETQGLLVRISPQGTATFVYRYQTQHDGKPVRRNIKIGRYGVISLSDARKTARGFASDRDRGVDPYSALQLDRHRQAEEAKAAQRAAKEHAEAPTVSTAWQHYQADVLSTAKSADNLRSIYRLYFQHMEGVTLADLDRHEIERYLRSIGEGTGRYRDERPKPTQANRAHELLRAVLNNAIRRELISTNPARLILPRRQQHLFPETPRDRYPTMEEIGRIWIATEEMTEGQRAAVRFAMLSLKRRSEICAAKTARVDRSAHVWTVPGSETKSGRPDRVPLTGGMLDLLPVEGEYAFPGKSANRPLSVGTLTRWFAKAAEHARILDITLHDLRRGGATFIEEHGFSRTVSEMILGHKQTQGGEAAHHYTGRVSLSGVRLQALEVWEAAITDEATRLHSDNVGKLHG